MTFKEGTTTLGTGTLNASGVATFTISTLAAGSHSIKATYNGDATFKTSTSAVLTQTVNRALVVSGGPASGVQDPAPLTQPMLAPIVAEAIARWQEAGAAPQGLAALSHVDVRIADLSGPLLGMAGTGVITIDQDAAGYGWFIDPTPADDSEFGAVAQGPARGRVDLLSVVAHELGHELGLDHDDGDDVMAEALPVGVRRVPVAVRAPGSLAAPLLSPQSSWPRAPCRSAPRRGVPASSWLRIDPPRSS